MSLYAVHDIFLLPTKVPAAVDSDDRSAMPGGHSAVTRTVNALQAPRSSFTRVWSQHAPLCTQSKVKSKSRSKSSHISSIHPFTLLLSLLSDRNHCDQLWALACVTGLQKHSHAISSFAQMWETTVLSLSR